MQPSFEHAPCTQPGVNPETYELPAKSKQHGYPLEKLFTCTDLAEKLCGNCPLMKSCAGMVLDTTEFVWQGVIVGGVPMPHDPSAPDKAATREALSMIVEGHTQMEALAQMRDMIATDYHKRRMQAATARIGRRRGRRPVPTRPGDTRPPRGATSAPTRPTTRGAL